MQIAKDALRSRDEVRQAACAQAESLLHGPLPLAQLGQAHDPLARVLQLPFPELGGAHADAARGLLGGGHPCPHAFQRKQPVSEVDEARRGRGLPFRLRLASRWLGLSNPLRRGPSRRWPLGLPGLSFPRHRRISPGVRAATRPRACACRAGARGCEPGAGGPRSPSRRSRGTR